MGWTLEERPSSSSRLDLHKHSRNSDTINKSQRGPFESLIQNPIIPGPREPASSESRLFPFFTCRAWNPGPGYYGFVGRMPFTALEVDFPHPLTRSKSRRSSALELKCLGGIERRERSFCRKDHLWRKKIIFSFLGLFIQDSVTTRPTQNAICNRKNGNSMK